MPDVRPDQTDEAYEAPAIELLGPVDEITRGVPDSDSITTTTTTG